MAKRISAALLLAAGMLLGSCSPDTCPSFSKDIVKANTHAIEIVANQSTQNSEFLV